MQKFFILSAFLTMLALAGCSGSKEDKESPTFDEVIQTRRSIRAYDATKKITKEEVREVIAAALEAPSWINFEPSKYYVAISEDKLAAVKELVGERNKRNVANAPVLIVSTYEQGKSGFMPDGQQLNEIGNGWGAYDNGLSNAFLILKARAMGFDTLIMGMRDADALRQLFGIPSNETVMAVIALGYRAENPRRPERRSVDEVTRFF
jgi:nitroreductase